MQFRARPPNRVIIDLVTGSNWRTVTLGASAFALGMFTAGSGSLRAAWTPVARLIGLHDAHAWRD